MRISSETSPENGYIDISFGYFKEICDNTITSILVQSFEIIGYILNNHKISIALDYCFKSSLFNLSGHFRYNPVI